MRSAKETGCFPYASKLVCFMELTPTGLLTQLQNKSDKADAYIRAKCGKSQLVAVWPGNWRSDLFTIDDLDAFAEANDI